MSGGVSAVEYSEGGVRELIEERMDPNNDALVATNRPKTSEVPTLELNPSIRTGGNYANLLYKLQDHVMRNWEMLTYPDLLRSYDPTLQLTVHIDFTDTPIGAWRFAETSADDIMRKPRAGARSIKI